MTFCDRPFGTLYLHLRGDTNELFKWVCWMARHVSSLTKELEDLQVNGHSDMEGLERLKKEKAVWEEVKKGLANLVMILKMMFAILSCCARIKFTVLSTKVCTLLPETSFEPRSHLVLRDL
ncbi:unnamed protein product [Calypogeia fissa]